MSWDLEKAKDELRNRGLRVTAPRVAVLKVLAESKRPLSHAEVVDELEEQVLSDKATVYRNLIALTEANLLRQATQAGRVTRFEPSERDDSRAHPHFVCSACGGVSCLPKAEVALPKRGTWAKSMKRAAVQFVGQCPACTKAG